MPRELLLAVHLEVALAVVDDDLVVHGLPREVLAVRVHGRVGDRLHVRLADVLGHDGDAELPQVDLLVVCRRDEAAPALDEGDGVDRAEVLLVLLSDLACVNVIL